MDEIDRLYKHYEDAKSIEYKKGHKCVPSSLQDAIAKGKKYVYYYFRKEYNDIKAPCIKAAALFIILNKLCFRGLYRAGKNGFNVAYGNYKKPTIYNKNNILKINQMFTTHNVIFKCQSYETITPTDQDLLYLDPPYYPIRKNAFESYGNKGFDHNALVSFSKRCKNFIQSNAWCEFTINNYPEYKCSKILCRRRINCKKPSDTDYEIMISTN